MGSPDKNNKQRAALSKRKRWESSVTPGNNTSETSLEGLFLCGLEHTALFLSLHAITRLHSLLHSFPLNASAYKAAEGGTALKTTAQQLLSLRVIVDEQGRRSHEARPGAA